MYFDSNFTEDFTKGPIDNKSAWVQVIYWHRKGDKPLPESNADPVIWRIYAARRGYALIECFMIYAARFILTFKIG